MSLAEVEASLYIAVIPVALIAKVLQQTRQSTC
jgi:hypothetical protein